jgi:hypothetical protein
LPKTLFQARPSYFCRQRQRQQRIGIALAPHRPCVMGAACRMSPACCYSPS